jgi:hypothetical protein
MLQNIESRRYFPCFVALLLACICFVGLIPNVSAATYNNVIVSNGDFQSEKLMDNSYKLYYTEDIPISIDWLLENPDKYIDVYCTSMFYVVSYPKSEGPYQVTETKPHRINAEWVLKNFTDLDSIDTSRGIYLRLVDSTTSASFKITSNIRYVQTTLDKILSITESVTGSSIDVASGILDWISSSSLLMFILIGIPVVSIIIYVLSKRVGM